MLLARLAIAVGFPLACLLLLARLARGEATEVGTLVARIAGGALLSALVLAVLLVLIRRVDRRPPREFGLTGRGDAGRAFCGGALAWLVSAVVAFAILGLAGKPLAVEGSLGEVVGISVLLIGAVLLSEAIPEELVFRGYVTGLLAECLHGWWIILTQAALFTAFALALRGLAGEVDLSDLSLFIGMGIGLGYLRMITGSVWTTIGFHTAFQTGSQLVLTQEVVSFSGSAELAMLALGAVPFAAGITMISWFTAAHPELFRRNARGREPGRAAAD